MDDSEQHNIAEQRQRKCEALEKANKALISQLDTIVQLKDCYEFTPKKALAVLQESLAGNLPTQQFSSLYRIRDQFKIFGSVITANPHYTPEPADKKILLTAYERLYEILGAIKALANDSVEAEDEEPSLEGSGTWKSGEDVGGGTAELEKSPTTPPAPFVREHLHHVGEQMEKYIATVRSIMEEVMEVPQVETKPEVNYTIDEPEEAEPESKSGGLSPAKEAIRKYTATQPHPKNPLPEQSLPVKSFDPLSTAGSVDFISSARNHTIQP